MLILIASTTLDIQSSLGEPADQTLDELRKTFIEKYGEDIYTKASKVVVVEDNFYNVIKDRYGPALIGEHNDFLDDLIDSHLAV